MSRFTEAFVGYNKNKKGKRIWCFATTEHNLIQDAIQRILFDRTYDYGYEVLTLKEIKSQYALYKPFICCFNDNVQQSLHERFETLINNATKQKAHLILFNMG